MNRKYNLYLWFINGFKIWFTRNYIRLSIKQLGKGTIIFPFISIRYPKNIKIGSNVEIRHGCALFAKGRNGLGITIGDRCRIKEYCILDSYGGYIELGEQVLLGQGSIIHGHGEVRIGSYSLIGQNVSILSNNHIFDSLPSHIQTQGEKLDKTIIGSNVWIGAGSLVLSGVNIGDHSVIAAGSIVTKDIESFSLYSGSPAFKRKSLNKKVLCFGDSNTWGQIPGKEDKYLLKDIWTKKLGKLLGPEFIIENNSAKGRVIKSDLVNSQEKNGINVLNELLKNSDFDYFTIIIYLGLNDLKNKYAKTIKMIGEDLAEMLDVLSDNFSNPLNVIVLGPTFLGDLKMFQNEFESRKDEIILMNEIFNNIVVKKNMIYVDNLDILTNTEDGLHLSKEQHNLISKKVFDKIRNLEL